MGPSPHVNLPVSSLLPTMTYTDQGILPSLKIAVSCEARNFCLEVGPPPWETTLHKIEGSWRRGPYAQIVCTARARRGQVGVGGPGPGCVPSASSRGLVTAGVPSGGGGATVSGQSLCQLGSRRRRRLCSGTGTHSWPHLWSRSCTCRRPTL